MIAAAGNLSPLSPHARNRGLKVHFLSGERFWYQTLFCFLSLHESAAEHIVPVVLDDGSMSPERSALLRHVIPWLEVVSQDDIVERLDHVVPVRNYPTLRYWRMRQPLLRKVIDLHAGQNGWKMYLDSDMLFFREPTWLMRWLSGPARPAYMVDCVEAYGYSHSLRARVAGCDRFPDRANIGIFGWLSDELDLGWLEYAVRTLIDEEGPRYNLTQGITSMMFAGRDCDVAPEREYLVLPSLEEGRFPTAVLHHYVAESKRSYFQHGWRHVVGHRAP
jgi:hypothetical protein